MASSDYHDLCVFITSVLYGRAVWQLTSAERALAEKMIKNRYLKIEQRDGVQTLIKT